MSHEQAWALLPDLLLDRGQPALLAHVAGCHDCQRQLFLLERVDRLLRDRAAVDRRRTRALPRRRAARVLAAPALAALAAGVLVLGSQRAAGERAFALRAGSGRLVGAAHLLPGGESDALVLVADRLPARRGAVEVLWAQDARAGRRLVGRVMVSPDGSCRARFRLPGGRSWLRFWIAPPGSPQAVLATT